MSAVVITGNIGVQNRSGNLSIVISGRNDDYDGDFNKRLVIALEKNISNLPYAEFIFVEWNPIPDKKLVCEVLQKMFGNKIRYFVVHPKFHKAYCTIDDFIEYPAKNVGVRRARRPFILCTNSDVVFSPQVCRRMCGILRTDVIYRATRVDIDRKFLDVKFPLPGSVRLEEHGGLMNASGDFLLMHRSLWLHSTGYCESFPEQRLHKDSLTPYILYKMNGNKWEDIGEVSHWRHSSSWSNNKRRPKVGNPAWRYDKSGWDSNGDKWGLWDSVLVNRNGINWLE